MNNDSNEKKKQLLLVVSECDFQPTHKLKCPQGIESRDSVLAGNTIRHIKGGWRREEKAVSSCEKGCAHNCSSTDQVRSLLYAVQSLSGSHCCVPPGPSIHCPPVLSLTV